MLAPAFKIYKFAFITSYTEMQTKPITLYFTESTGRHSNSYFQLQSNGLIQSWMFVLRFCK